MERIPFTHLVLVKDEVSAEQVRRQNAFMQDLLHWDKQWGIRQEKYHATDKSPTYLFPRKDW